MIYKEEFYQPVSRMYSWPFLIGKFLFHLEESSIDCRLRAFKVERSLFFVH